MLGSISGRKEVNPAASHCARAIPASLETDLLGEGRNAKTFENGQRSDRGQQNQNGSRHIHIPSLLNIPLIIVGASRSTNRASSMFMKSSCDLVRSSRKSMKAGYLILISSSLLPTSSKECNSVAIRITLPCSMPRIAAMNTGDEEFCREPKVSTSGAMP